MHLAPKSSWRRAHQTRCSQQCRAPRLATTAGLTPDRRLGLASPRDRVARADDRMRIRRRAPGEPMVVRQFCSAALKRQVQTSAALARCCDESDASKRRDRHRRGLPLRRQRDHVRVLRSRRCFWCQAITMRRLIPRLTAYPQCNDCRAGERAVDGVVRRSFSRERDDGVLSDIDNPRSGGNWKRE